MFFVVVETSLYLQSIYVHSANLCEDWVLWLGEGHSVVLFRSYWGYEPVGAWGNTTCI
jgi:hypothetical protein